MRTTQLLFFAISFILLQTNLDAQTRNELAGGVIKEIPGADHYVFLIHPKETEALIRNFLLK